MLFEIPLEPKLPGWKPAIGSGPLKQLKGSITHLDANDLRLVKRVDYCKVFNLMAIGLYEGKKPPFMAGNLKEIPAAIQAYEGVASLARSGKDSEDYYRPNQAAAILKKLEGVPFPGFDPKSNAISGWYASEEICRETNKRIWDLKQTPLSSWDEPLAVLLRSLQTEILQLLGETPPDFEEVMQFGKFGPGTSLSTDMESLDPILKTVNPSALTSLKGEIFHLYERSLMGDAVVRAGYGCNPTNSRRSVARLAIDVTEFNDHARLSTVPKNYATDRCIEIGGSLTTWVQQAYDGFIRRRLEARWGLDLKNQVPNQDLAFRGSLESRSRNFCTIDMTSASDRIAFGLVVSILPRAWAKCLVAMTNRSTLVEGELVKLEKFSAMGNSITFSLMTAIFGAVVRSVLRDRGFQRMSWRVYGDDIIVEEPIYEQVVDHLHLLGFEINAKKSYSRDYFRESCGVDYLCGTSVRALYIKEPIKIVPDVYKYLNLIQLHIKGFPVRARWFRPLYEYLLHLIPCEHRVYGSPSRNLAGYIWCPSMGPVYSRQAPSSLLIRCTPGETPGDARWAMWRGLLVGEHGDSRLDWKVSPSAPSGKFSRRHKRPVITTVVELYIRNKGGMPLAFLSWSAEEGRLNPLLI
jgi:hypothetical protein